MTSGPLWKVFLSILIIAAIVWAVSVFVLPLLPPPFSSWILLAVAAFVGVATVYAAINEAEELFARHFGAQAQHPKPPDGSTAMKLAILSDTSQKQQLRILFVDDDDDFRQNWALHLQNAGYEVIQARDSAEAYRIYSNGGVDLAVVDLRLLNDTERDYSGARLAQEMKAIPRIILSVDTSGKAVERAIGVIPSEGPPAFAYAFKEDGPDALVKKILGVLEQSKTIWQGVSPYRAQGEHRIVLTCEPGRPVRIQILPLPGREASSERNLELDERHFAEAADHLPGSNWQIGCRQIGEDLFQAVFVSPGRVVERYSEVLGPGVPRDHLHLRFVASRTLLGVPLECCFDATRGEGDFLVLHHPFSRSVLDTRSQGTPIDPDFLNSLRAENRELRVLLVAADTASPIPDANEEVRQLRKALPLAFLEHGVRVAIEVVSGRQATCKGIQERLGGSHYHIVHYAGHSFFDSTSPQDSGLLLWNGSRNKKNVELMRVSALAMHLQQAQVQFVYLSCCESTRVSDPKRLVDNNLLGIADDIVHRGIPAVLGHRWLVPGQRAKELALAFYLSLAQTGQLDTALYHARRSLYGQNPADITWLSPVLIMQS